MNKTSREHGNMKIKPSPNIQEIHEWQCPKCKKKIISFYERQFDQQRKAHLDSHKNKESK